MEVSPRRNAAASLHRRRDTPPAGAITPEQEPHEMSYQAPSVVDVEEYEDAKDAWRCPHLSTRTAGPGDEEVRGGTLVRIDGDEHRKRRRALGKLLSQGGHKYFRDKFLFPTGDAALAAALANPDEDGIVRLEVRRWARRINQQLAAALVGFDDATTPEGSDELFGYVERFLGGYQNIVENALRPYDMDPEIRRVAKVARDEMVARFYEPSLERRRQLVAQVAAGELDEADLPQDFLTLVAQGADPAWEDDALAKREAVFLLGAGVHTTANSLVWTLRELFDHFEKHPEDKAKKRDDTFLLAAAREAIRLHPVSEGFLRRVEEDYDLPSGVELHQGEIVMIRSGPASADVEHFGPDAMEFNPHRVVERGVSPHGFAFGGGQHMCFGMPLVMGAEGLDGSLVYLIKLLMSADVEPDPETPYLPLDQSRAIQDPGHKVMPLIVRLNPSSTSSIEGAHA
jgi:cytochrome P450